MDKPNEKFVEIPVWFLKLCGGIFSVCAVLVLGWASWVTVTMLDIRSEIGTSAEMKARISLLEKENVEIKLALAKLVK